MPRPVTAKVFARGVGRPFKLVEPDTDTIFDVLKNGDTGWLEGVTVEGERVLLDIRQVLDVIAPSSEPETLPSEAIFDGRRITVRSYDTWRRQEDRAGSTEVWDKYSFPAFVVLGEDMAEVALVVGTTDGRMLWGNPASEDGVNERYLRAAILMAEAETIQVNADDPSFLTPTNERKAALLLAQGDVPTAIATAGVSYVAAFLGNAKNTGVEDGPVRGTLFDGDRPFVIDGWDPDTNNLKVSSPSHEGVEVFEIDVTEIESITLPA